MKRRDLIIFKIAFRFNYTFYLQPEMSRESLFSYSIVDQGLFYLLNRSVYYPILDRIFLVIQEKSTTSSKIDLILMRIDPSGVFSTFDW